MQFVFIGLAAGVLSGEVLEVGSQIGVIVPALILFAGLKANDATGTSLGALLLPVGILGAWSWHQKGHVNIKASLLIALGLAVGAFFGAQLGLRMSVPVLQRSFAIFLVAVAVQLWMKASH